MENANERLAKLEAQNADHERRIARSESLTEQIHRLGVSVEGLTAQVKGLVESIDARLKEQGRRIGDIETKGSKKFENIATAIITAGLTAAVMYFVAG